MTVSASGSATSDVPSIAALWASTDAGTWNHALARYWDFVRPENMALERALDVLDLGRLRRMGAPQWLAFLTDEYFRWKYTQPNRYGSTTAQLRAFTQRHGVGRLDEIRQQLLKSRPDLSRSRSLS